jgi:hypothetical protein
MSEKISEYITSVTALASGDLMDVSKLISTSPLEYQSQKLNYSVLISELNNDLTFPNLANTDLTSSIAGRSFYLYGNTGSDSLRFRSLAGNQILSLYGSGGVVIGNATTYGALQIYLSALDANGDLYYRNAGGNVAALPIGTAGQVLTVSGGGIPSWASISAPNLGSANLTSSDDARTFTLKSGGTASQNLQFLNSGGGNLLKLSGNKAIDFGSSTNTINPKFYLDGDIYQYFSIYNKTNANSICDIFAGAIYGNGVFYLKNSLGTPNISMNAGIGATPQMAIMSLAGQYSRYRVYNSLGNIVVNLGASNSDKGDLELYNSSGNIKVNITAGYSAFDALMKIGGSFAIATAQLQVVGSGSTSATTTALFENSASVAALKVKDDGYCILRANNAAIASGDLANNEMSFYIDEGTNHCVVKVKYSSGTVKTGTFNLT